MSRIGLLVLLLLVVFPVSAQQSSTERNREAFLQIAEAFNQGNVRSVLMDVMSPNFVNHSPNGDGNRLSAIGTIEAYRQAMPDLTLTPEIVLADGNYVMGRFVFSGTFQQPFVIPQQDAIPPTGQSVQFTLETIYRFDEQGQAIEEWLLWDNLSLLTQLRVIPNPNEQSAAEATDPGS